MGKEVWHVHIKTALCMKRAVLIFQSSTEKVAEAAEKGATSVLSLHPETNMSTPEGAPGASDSGGPPAAAPNLTSNRRLQQTQAQVDEVVDIMRVNVDKVLERDQKLSELDDRADALQAGASQFESSAAKLKNKYWWKNCKMMIIMAIVGVIFFGVIFLYFFY
uniref:V-SNARE coiled-coil homology domain-containing protein n=1 Tax=Knipowitschia caucasica TaxID=637954 RepID=A0AAV2K1E7_KNICA